MNEKEVKSEFGLIVLASYSTKEIILWGLWANALFDLDRVRKELDN